MIRVPISKEIECFVKGMKIETLLRRAFQKGYKDSIGLIYSEYASFNLIPGHVLAWWESKEWWKTTYKLYQFCHMISTYSVNI